MPATATQPPIANLSLLEQCRVGLQNEKLTLPTLPDISLKIRRAINDERASNSRIAKVVQIDPTITARLIHVANSPLYRGRRKIESCPEALTRLGLKAAQHLITSFALKSVFVAKSKHIQKLMQELWAHSSYVAAICAVLAHKTRGFDPDRAMLAGLIHDIGVVPILTFLDKHPELIGGESALANTVEELRGPVGVAIMRQWNFPADFEDVVMQAENWYRDSGPEPDYTDLVLVSQLHSYVGTLQIHKYPRMDEIPAYRKLLSGPNDFDMSMNILDAAKEDIWHIQQMLTR